MGGILLLFGFLLSGVMLSEALFAKKCGLVRLWTGLCMGFMMMMWLPALYAFFIDFTRAAQLYALATAMFAALGSFAGLRSDALGRMFSAMLRGLLSKGAERRRRFAEMRAAAGEAFRPRSNGSFFGEIPWKLYLILILPLMILSVYLLYTHTIQPQNGALHVGQSTYGDLCLHLGIATSLQNASFPPDYSILPGALLGYPFLADSMVSSMLLFGSDLAFSFVLTAAIMMLLVYTGFIIFAWELTKNRAAVVIAYVLMFINGGLGFLYHLDGVMQDPSMFRAIFTGFYQTPTNMPELNLRWVNVIVDMMIPQRTLLTGWMTLLPALYMLVDALRSRQLSRFVLLGIWAGFMPMVHTHSFFALGLLSVGVTGYTLLHAPEGKRANLLIRFLCYGLIAVALALPQLVTWAFPQTLNGNGLNIRFNWVNNQGDGTLIDGYFWFWIKNVGLVYLFMLPAALSMKKGSLQRALCIGALVIYTVAELIQFQPNPYDNNKLFYVAFMVMLPVVATYLVRLWNQLKGIRGRALFAAVFIAACTLSGTLSIAREVVSDYQLLGRNEVQAAEYIKENTDENAVILTGTQHNNAVAALTGRYIVCGTGSYLYYHGLDYYDEQSAVKAMLSDPQNNIALFEEYNVDYVYISGHERGEFAADEAWFRGNLDLVYDVDNVAIYSCAPLKDAA